MIDNEFFTFEHFRVREAFNHCTDAEISECIRKDYLPNVLTTLHHLDNIRSMFGKPIYITSCYRGFEHNKRCGGVSTSQHLTGCAVDIQPWKANSSRYELDDLKKLAHVVAEYAHTAGCYGQFILYDNFLHLGLLDDSRDNTSYFHEVFTDPQLKYFYELSK